MAIRPARLFSIIFDTSICLYLTIKRFLCLSQISHIFITIFDDRNHRLNPHQSDFVSTCHLPTLSDNDGSPPDQRNSRSVGPPDPVPGNAGK